MSLPREVSTRRTHRLAMPQPPASTLSDGVVSLRLPHPNDATLLAEYVESGSLDGMWVGGPDEESDSLTWANATVAGWRQGWTDAGSDDGPALIADEASPFVGVVSFCPLDSEVVEVLYGVHPQHRRRGVATRALKLASDWILGATPFRVAELKISETNAGSLLVARNAGFTFVERFETFVTGTGQTHIDHRFMRGR